MSTTLNALKKQIIMSEICLIRGTIEQHHNVMSLTSWESNI